MIKVCDHMTTQSTWRVWLGESRHREEETRFCCLFLLSATYYLEFQPHLTYQQLNSHSICLETKGLIVMDPVSHKEMAAHQANVDRLGLEHVTLQSVGSSQAGYSEICGIKCDFRREANMALWRSVLCRQHVGDAIGSGPFHELLGRSVGDSIRINKILLPQRLQAQSFSLKIILVGW